MIFTLRALTIVKLWMPFHFSLFLLKLNEMAQKKIFLMKVDWKSVIQHKNTFPLNLTNCERICTYWLTNLSCHSFNYKIKFIFQYRNEKV